MQEILDPIDEMLLKQVHKGASTEEMCEATGIKSTSTIQSRLERLQYEGYITPPKRTLRGSRPPGHDRSPTKDGGISMGANWSATDEIQALRLLLNGDTYYGAPSDGQLSGLGGLITQGLSSGKGVVSKRNMRLLILSAITGIKQLSPLLNADASSALPVNDN